MHDLTWHAVEPEMLEGVGWPDAARNFARLPDKAEAMVHQELWRRTRESAGLCLRFESDSPVIHARWELLKEPLALPHMPATGVSGLDLYVRRDGGYRWVGLGKPTALVNDQSLTNGELDAGDKDFLLYLPLYNSVRTLRLGVPASHSFHFLPPRKVADGGIVFYGTSITQGGCASRPGMNHVATLGRQLDIPVINLGIGGNGRMEIELAELLGELAPSLYVIDCRANMTAELIAERYLPFVRRLRELKPRTPLLLSKGCAYTDAHGVAARRDHLKAGWAAIEAAWAALEAEGVEGLFYLEPDGQLGDDDLGTVDGTHPTDLGFARQAERMLPVLVAALESR